VEVRGEEHLTTNLGVINQYLVPTSLSEKFGGFFYVRIVSVFNKIHTPAG
jgi:hypothetical protein